MNFVQIADFDCGLVATERLNFRKKKKKKKNEKKKKKKKTTTKKNIQKSFSQKSYGGWSWNFAYMFMTAAST